MASSGLIEDHFETTRNEESKVRRSRLRLGRNVVSLVVVTTNRISSSEDQAASVTVHDSWLLRWDPDARRPAGSRRDRRRRARQQHAMDTRIECSARRQAFEFDAFVASEPQIPR